MQHRRLGSPQRTAILCAMGLIASLVMLVTLVVSISGADSVARGLATRDLPTQNALRETSTAAAAQGAEPAADEPVIVASV